MPRYFVLAKGAKVLPLSGNYPWPYEVSLCFTPVACPVGFAEGVGHGAAGGVFTAQEALQPQWREHLAAAKGEWLLPYIERLANGERLDESSLLAAATERLGEVPESYEYRGA